MSSSSRRTKVFIGYCHEDARYFNQLLKHLTYYERNNKLEIWSDKKNAAGAQWHQEIKQAIETTRIAILLISPGFMASDFIAEKQLPPLLNAAKKDGMMVVPVIVRPFNLDDTELGNFQPMNGSPDMPVAKMKSVQRDDLWVRLIKIITSQQRSHVSEKKSSKESFILEGTEETEEAMYGEAREKLNVDGKGAVAYLRMIALSSSLSEKRKEHS